MISHLAHSRPVRIAAGVYLLLALVCTQIPLVNSLGYEFSVVVALGATWVGAWIAFRETVPVYRRPGSTGGAATLEAFRVSLTANVLLLAIPAVVMAGNALFVKNCSMLLGVAFYLCIPVVTVCFVNALALFCALHYRFARTVYFLCVLATFLYAGAIGYWTPAVFSYNPFYGYFPGFTYDEILELRWPLVTFRVVTLFVAAIFVGMSVLLLRVSAPWDSVPRKGLAMLRALFGPGVRFVSLAALLILGAVYYFRCELGYESTAAYIRHVLGSAYTTDHFTLYYDSTSIDTSEIHWIAAEHEFCLAKAWDAFVLPHRGRVDSYIYPSAEVKLRLIGAGNTSIAKPWSREVHIARPALEAVLQHELIHVVAGIFGVPVLRASLSPGVTEGLAMALEGEQGTRTLHQQASAIQRAGIMPNVRRLFSLTGFLTQNSSVSYVLAGSFCRYLIDRFGIRKMVQLYSENDFLAIYGRTLDRLVLDWTHFLGRFPELPGDPEMVDAMFRRPPIFGKVCARVIAARNARGRELLVRKDYPAAADVYARSYRESGNTEALGGWLTSALRAGTFDVLTSVYDTIVCRAERPTEYLPLYLQIGDAFWARDSLMPALELYSHVQRADLSPSYTEAAMLRSIAIDDSACRDGLLRFILSPDPDSVRIRILDSLLIVAPGDRVVLLLRGRALLRLGRYAEALAAFDAFDFGETDARLETGRRLAVAHTLVRLKRFQDAKAAFWTSLNIAYSDAAEAEVNRWTDWCDWLTEHGLP